MNTLIRASAGSGKTYALTTEYLRLLRDRQRALPADEAGQSADGGLGVETVLAATFTRKAAGEIFRRVLSRLADATLDEAARAALAAALGDPALTQDACGDLLLRLCRSLHRLSIGTLDSFFGRLCTVYGVESGLAGREVCMTDPKHPRCAALQRDALRIMLAGMPPEQSAGLLDGLTRGKASAGVLAEFLDLVDGLSETVAGLEDGVWDRIAVPPAPTSDAALAAREFLRLAAPSFRLDSWRKALAGDLERFEEGRWEEFLAKGLSAGCRKSPAKYGGGKEEIAAEIVAQYEVLHAHAAAELLGGLRRRTAALRDLCRHFTREYETLRRAEGLLLFSETPRLLATVLGDAGETARRLGGGLEHLLLDEFQDTSDPQWALLQEFALPAACGTGSVFVVGDAKQAIYGWRGGRAEIFERIGTVIPQMETQDRDVSFRSAQTVLDAVNAVFQGLTGNEAMAGCAEPAKRWSVYFQAHQAHKSLPGWVELSVSPTPSDPSAMEEAVGDEDEGNADAPRHLVKCAERIAGEVRRLPHGATAGVLVRTNKTAARLSDLLRSQGVEVSSEGMGQIADDPAVELILSALTFADHPGHTAAAYHVAQSPLAAAVGLSPEDCAQPPSVQSAASRLRRQVLAQGYAGVTAAWAATLAPCGPARTARRLEQLVGLALEYDALPPMRPSEFVRAVRASAVENPGAAPLRVMTINRAKGLEFDAVFLPELDWRVNATPKACLVKRASAEAIAAGLPPVEAVYAHPNKALQELLPGLAEAAQSVQDEETTGMLCLLYVAMTRARQSLHLYLPPRRINSDGTPGALGLSPASLLRGALGAGPDDTRQGLGWTTLYEAGGRPWGDWGADVDAPAPIETPRPEFRFRPSDGPRRSALLKQATASKATPRTAADLLRLE